MDNHPFSQEIRRNFLDFFRAQGHAVLPSSPTIPHDDPTLLFANAGMNQFKDLFLGKATADYTRAATCQKCIRGGGKHNDLDNVGHTSRHLTFFEMLGNFSFGDYFKQEAIDWAWTLTRDVFGFDPNKVFITVFREDDEAEAIWRRHVPASRIVRMDEKDNFWAMGDTGPCGPCSELYYDRGPAYGSGTSPKDDPSGERYLEFWNLVFMQFNKKSDGVQERLPKPSIDTGAGLERVISLKMGVDSVFLTDVLRGLIAQVENLSGKRYKGPTDALAPTFHVIADHLRSFSFAVADGARPGNTDRGYVLRKLLRRAVRYGRGLGFEAPFMAQVLPRLIDLMGADYPELKKSQPMIAEVLTSEEEAFFKTLKRGGNLLASVVESSKKSGIISGDDAFKLKDTYGLPFEEIALIARDTHVKIDEGRYQALEAEAKSRSKAASKMAASHIDVALFDGVKPTEFIGYTEEFGQAKVIAIIQDGARVSALTAGQEGSVILDKTPFYAEKGGQVGDSGFLSGSIGRFHVRDTQSPALGVVVHTGRLEGGTLQVGDGVNAEIDPVRRAAIRRAHTATHLLQWALVKVAGEHVAQAGSVVEADRLRFDFSHNKALTAEQLHQIEDLVNAKILENSEVRVYEKAFAEIKQDPSIKQFFGEKYGAQVRVVDIDFSKELCGGTHVAATGDIGFFRIGSESSIAAGVRRIEAACGMLAAHAARGDKSLIDSIAEKLKTTKIVDRIDQLLEQNKELDKQLKGLKTESLRAQARELAKQGRVVVAEVIGSADDLKLLAEMLTVDAVLLGSKVDGRCFFVAKSSKASARALVQELAPIVEGSGGGRDEFAQGSGKAANHLGKALDHGKAWLTAQIG